jgi:hypothetical protein
MAHVMLFERPIAAKRPLHRPVASTPQFVMLRHEYPLWPSMAPLRQAIQQARQGDWVAFAVALDTPFLTRLMTLATLRWQLRRAERAIRSSGGEVVTHFGVDPSLAQPSWFYELNTPASEYSDRFMRPRGSNVALRRLAERLFGCDPALGGVLVVGRKKPC